MQETKEPTPRRRGRPQTRPDAETRQLIVEAARAEFQARGYAATTMEAVARRTGVSTKTLYRLVPTKSDLFEDVVSDRIGIFMLALDDLSLSGLDIEAAVERVLVAYGTLTLNANVIAINRLVIGESERFPEIATTFYEHAILLTGRAMEAWLRRQCDHGLIELDDPHTATEMLRGMMIMDPQRAAILGQRAAPGIDEIAARAKLCAKLFVQGCRARKPH
jgi:AcrR family transcriptional regulator